MPEPYSMSPPPLLLAANGGASPHLMERLLRPRGFTVRTAGSQEALLREVEESAPDLIALDADLPGVAVIDTCRRLAALTGPVVPVIVTAAAPLTREQRLALLDSGAWECVTPPVDPAELLLKIDRYVRAKRECDRARSQGLADPASGLYNRQGLARRAREVGAEAFRAHASVASVVFAFDQNPGAAAADAAPAWARAFREAGRASDVVARLSTDEVAVLAPATDLDGVRRLAQRFLAALEGLRGEDGAPLPIRAGCHAVANLGYTPTAPLDIVLEAAAEARRSPAGPPAEWVRRFDRDGPSGAAEIN